MIVSQLDVNHPGGALSLPPSDVTSASGVVGGQEDVRAQSHLKPAVGLIVNGEILQPAGNGMVGIGNPDLELHIMQVGRAGLLHRPVFPRLLMVAASNDIGVLVPSRKGSQRVM